MADLKLQKMAGELEAKRGELAAFLAKHRAGDTYDMDSAGVEEVNNRNTELEKLAAEYNSYAKVLQIASANDAELKQLGRPADGLVLPGAGGNQPAAKSFGDLFVASAAYKSKNTEAKLAGVNLKGAMAEARFKTLFQESAGFQPEIVRNRPVLLMGQPPLDILDVLPMRETNQPGIKYMEETTYVNPAQETNEGSQFPEAQLAFTEKYSVARKIAVFIPVTDEQLADVSYIRQYLNDRLGLMLRQRLASQVINGDGSVVNGQTTLVGMLNFAGILTQAKATDPVFDAFLKAYTKIRTSPGGYSNPTVNVLNPTDLTNIRLTRTADGRYIFGDPGQQPANISIFGVPCVEAVQQPQGTGFTKDANFLELCMYQDVDVEVSNSHADYFIKGIQAVRATIRVIFHDYRPISGCEVTGL